MSQVDDELDLLRQVFAEAPEPSARELARAMAVVEDGPGRSVPTVHRWRWSVRAGVNLSAAAAVIAAVILALTVFSAGGSRGGIAPRPVTPPPAPKWKVLSVPALGRPNGWLEGVSCVSSHFCVAIGFAATRQQSQGRPPLAEEWGGTHWAVLPNVVTPENAAGNNGRLVQLNSVSCASTTMCMVAGGYQVRGRADLTPLIEEWNGEQWSIMRLAGTGLVDAYGAVSCASTHACVAVGIDKPTGNKIVPASEVWNGRDWALVDLPSEPGRGLPVDISCDPTGSCIAVGWTIVPARRGTTAPVTPRAYIWMNGRWRNTSVADPAHSVTTLQWVSCPEKDACLALGIELAPVPATRKSDGSSADTIVERWNGAHWTIVDARGVGQDVPGSNVACVSASSCVAADTVIEQWNGRRWATVANVPGGLYGLSCVPSGFCMAVGTYSGSRTGALAMRN